MAIGRSKSRGVCFVVATMLTAAGAVLLQLGLRIPSEHPLLVRASLLTGAALLVPASFLLIWLNQNFVQSHFAVSMAVGYFFNVLAWAFLFLLVHWLFAKIRGRSANP